MTTKAIKKQLDSYIPLLTAGQQELLLNMVKNILHVETSNKRISRKQYNKEIEVSEKQIRTGKFLTQSELEKESGKW